MNTQLECSGGWRLFLKGVLVGAHFCCNFAMAGDGAIKMLGLLAMVISVFMLGYGASTHAFSNGGAISYTETFQVPEGYKVVPVDFGTKPAAVLEGAAVSEGNKVEPDQNADREFQVPKGFKLVPEEASLRYSKHPPSKQLKLLLCSRTNLTVLRLARPDLTAPTIQNV